MEPPVDSPYPRTLHAIMVEFIADQYLAICCWPDHEPEKPCAKLPDPAASWLDVKAGDEVYLKKMSKVSKRAVRDVRIVKQIVLYRVFPVEYCDRVVSSACDWLEGRDDGIVVPRR